MHPHTIITSGIAIVAIAIGGWLMERAIIPQTDQVPAGSLQAVSMEQAQTASQAEQEAAYQSAVRAMLPRYQAALASGAEDELRTVQDELLALQVPARHRDAHAALVLLVDWRLDGGSAAQAAERFASMTNTYPWLIE